MKKSFALAVLVALVAVAAWSDPLAAFPTGIESFPWGIDINPVTTRIYVALSEQDRLAVADAQTGKILKSVAVGRAPLGVAVDPQRNRVYVANLSSRSLSIIDGATDAVIATVSVGMQPFRVAVNWVSNRIYVTDPQTDKVWVVDGTTQSVIGGIESGGNARDIAVNSATDRVYVAHSLGPDSHLSVIDGATNTLLTKIPTPRYTEGVAVNPVTNKIYVAARESITVVDGVTHTIIGTISYPSRGVQAIDVDPPMNRLYAAVGSPFGTERLSLVDTTTDTIIGSMFLALSPFDMAVDRATHRVYIAHWCLSNVAVVFGKELLDNSSFEGAAQTGRPRFWHERSVTPDDGVEEIACYTGGDLVYEGGRSLRLTGTAGVGKEVFQDVEMTGEAGTVINLEGASRATDTSPAGGRYQIKAQVFFTDGTRDTFSVNFPKRSHSWRRELKAVTVPKPFSRVRVSLVYENQTGTAWFDAVHLWTTP